MRSAIVVALVLAGAWACGSASSDGPDDLSPGSSTEVDLTYCTRYCDAQERAGTLEGTTDECIRQCCKGAAADCRAPDASAGADAAESDASHPAASDASTCARPCGSNCCQPDEGCALGAGGQGQCVKTCATSADCPTGCCAPATNAQGDPVGPYICKPNDGNAYDCCFGVFNTCGEGTCCVADSKGNKFCARQCLDNSHCGAARCEGFKFSFTSTTCSGQETACGP